jgi:hypothetical protein
MLSAMMGYPRRRAWTSSTDKQFAANQRFVRHAICVAVMFTLLVNLLKL